MKLPLATISAVNGASSGTFRVGGRYVLRVDRRFAAARQAVAADRLAAEHYVDASPVDRWDVAIDGPYVVLRDRVREATLEGRELVRGGLERRFDLGRGHFVVRGDDAELTLYDAGSPVVWSERGTLVAAPRAS